MSLFSGTFHKQAESSSPPVTIIAPSAEKQQTRKAHEVGCASLASTSPVFVFHNRKVPSVEQVARIAPDGEKSQQLIWKYKTNKI